VADDDRSVISSPQRRRPAIRDNDKIMHQGLPVIAIMR
jgi:hypothetical protein